MAPSGSWTSAPKEAFIVGLKELPESDDPVTHRHIFYAHAYKVGLWICNLELHIGHQSGRGSSFIWPLKDTILKQTDK